MIQNTLNPSNINGSLSSLTFINCSPWEPFVERCRLEQLSTRIPDELLGVDVKMILMLKDMDHISIDSF